MAETPNVIDYRVASRSEETDMYAVIEDAAAEIPVLLDTEPRQEAMRGIITECHKSGKSWVAANSSGGIVGCALARPDFHENGAVSLRYIAVGKNSRRQGVFATLIEKLKANGAPLTTNVLRTNKSKMGNRLIKVGFVEVETDNRETKYRWDPPKPDAV